MWSQAVVARSAWGGGEHIWRGGGEQTPAVLQLGLIIGRAGPGSGRANRNPTFLFVGPCSTRLEHQAKNLGPRPPDAWPDGLRADPVARPRLPSPCSPLLRLATLDRVWPLGAAPVPILATPGDPPLLPDPSWQRMAARRRPWPRMAARR